ncbi:MAG: hypothetical protein FWC16_10665 [Defluviitaleaceae bacterium]|nr:hypothetical protein [Defluviitaleaceae bacterium]MCL2275379.1 hypothetical protein [Defluviitaleaceae bacterium]
MIAQHFYTREARGYTTVAHSEGLTQDEIKRLILPYCTYSAGVNGKSLTAVHHPCGHMLLGQAADTGKGFFQHNYLIPPKMAEEALEALWKGAAFETSYSSASNGSLPALGALPLSPKPHTPFEESVDPTYVIRCLTQAIASSKKVYIRAPQGNVHEYACGVLVALYPHLPVPLRHMLGFCTYAREPLHKKGIHVIFVDDLRILQKGGHFLIDFMRQSGIMEPPQADTKTPPHECAEAHSFFEARFAAMQLEKFCACVFDEIEFWRARVPDILRTAHFRNTVKSRVAQVLSAEAPLPDAFIRNGIIGRYAEIIGHAPADFVVHDILRRVLEWKKKGEAVDLRYFLGSYRLTPAARQKLTRILQSEGYTDDSP